MPDERSSLVQLCEPAEHVEIKQLSIDDLDDVHRSILVRAISRVISTDIAEETYAQILDGLPLADVADDSSSGDLPDGHHPLRDTHQELCSGTIEQIREFRASFQHESLRFDSRLLYVYQIASPGSRSFKTRLVEMVAVSVHQISVILFKLDTSLHKDDGVTEWQPPKTDTVYWTYCPEGPLPTLFTHPWYLDYDQYPNGVADMVGYWAEARILGGVVLFDRRTQDVAAGADLDMIYFHSNRQGVTYRIYQLVDDQKESLLDFLIADSTGESPLPILGNERNWKRVDPEESIRQTGIYRDIWERKDLPPDGPDERLRDVWDQLEFPTWSDLIGAQQRAMERRSRWG